MDFRMGLQCTLRVRCNDIPEYDSRLHNPLAFLIFACGILADRKGATFDVGGFGQELWPVDLDSDLPAFLSQLPSSINAARRCNSFDIDFYEQGLERVLKFEHSEAVWNVKCISSSNWMPNPCEIALDHKFLLQTLSHILDEFRECIGDTLVATCSWDVAARDWLSARWFP